MEGYYKTGTKLNTKQTLKISLQFSDWFRFSLVLFLFGVALVLSGSTAEAASLYFSPSTGSYNVGSNFSVGVFVSSPDQLMNAAGGAVSFPRDKLEITSLSKNGSIITFWAQEPIFSNTAGTVNFEGVVLPSGFSGQTGRIITITFRAKAAGISMLKFTESSVLAHDGMGTNILQAISGAEYTIGATTAPVSEPTPTPTPTPTPVVGTSHTELPEHFIITEILRENLANPIASFEFDAKDKTSGISHYEIWLNGNRQNDWKDDGTKVYTTAVLKSGEYELLARAVNFAGNYLEKKIIFSVTALKPPEIISYPSRIAPGDFLVIQGIAPPSHKIETWAEKNGEEIKIGETIADEKGVFKFVYYEFLGKGKYRVWTATSEWGARSERSQEIEIHVGLPFILQFGKLIVDSLIILIVLIAGTIAFILYTKKIRTEAEEKSQTVSKAFSFLQEEIKEQIKYLDRKIGITREEWEIREKLRETLNSKEIKDTEKESK